MKYFKNNQYKFNKTLLMLVSIYCVLICNTLFSEESDSCNKFAFPLPWSQIYTPKCTLSVKSCTTISSVTFKAQYIPKDDSLPRITQIGHITRTPYKLIWDIAKIPNQLTYGISCIAEITNLNGNIEFIEQQGVFLKHHQLNNPQYDIVFDTDQKSISNAITLSSVKTDATAKITISWNKKALMFHADVNNPLFYTTLEKRKLDKVGLKISLDTKNKREAFLTKDIHIFMIPVASKPYRVIAKSYYDTDKTFDIKEIRDSCNFYSHAIAENFKGYSIDFHIPMSFFGAEIPKKIGCNIFTTIIDEDSRVMELSWTKGNHYSVYSPFSFGTLNFLDKPILANLFIMWFVCFLVGAIFGILILNIIKTSKRHNTITRFEDKEQEGKYIKSINTIIEAEMTNRNFSITDISSKLKLSNGKVNHIMKKYYKKNFTRHLLFARIEIVKERLRSSNASEISIAKSCGFSSVDEMEKTFHSFSGTTPYKYREENRVT